MLQVKSRVLIIHAEDDWFIPNDHSRGELIMYFNIDCIIKLNFKSLFKKKELLKLCNEKRSRDYPPVKLVEIEKRPQLGHLKLYSHKEIIPTLK